MKTQSYEQQAQEFLDKTGTTFDAKFRYHGKYFDDDKNTRDVYEITFIRKNVQWTFSFGQSISHSGTANNTLNRQAPTAYDVLTCIEKYDPGTFEEFCDSFGYDTDSRKAEKTYFAVQNEHAHMRKMFGDVLEQLQEIQ